MGLDAFTLIWGLAIFGIVLKLVDVSRFRRLSVVLYLGMGWLVVIATEPMLASIDKGGLLLLLCGGLSYTLGIVFYAWDRLTWNHAIWHLFVLAGSSFHFFAVLYYVVPAAPA